MTDIAVGSMLMEGEGAGPPVVMVHGLGGTSNSFQTLLSALQGYRVYRPDLPGAGRSPLRPGLPGLKGLAVAVEDFLKAAEIEKAHFVGHSMGTLICQALAAKCPEKVASLALFGALTEPPVAARQALKERAELARRTGMAAIADAVSSAAVAPGNGLASAFVRESLLRQDPAGYAAHCEALSIAKAVDPQAILCPTLLIAGGQDRVAPPAMAKQLQQGICGAELEILPGVAHWMALEAPELCAQLLRSHLDANTLS